jgi:hypothetical protein
MLIVHRRTLLPLLLLLLLLPGAQVAQAQGGVRGLH